MTESRDKAGESPQADLFADGIHPTAGPVGNVFEQLRQEHGLPQLLRTDYGPEFLGETFTVWAKEAGMAIQYIQPGKPNQNAYIERSTVECLCPCSR